MEPSFHSRAGGFEAFARQILLMHGQYILVVLHLPPSVHLAWGIDVTHRLLFDILQVINPVVNPNYNHVFDR